jgi:hypothetical protein
MASDTEQLSRFVGSVLTKAGCVHWTRITKVGSIYNILIEWETGETAYEACNMIAKMIRSHAPSMLDALLLDTPGWKCSKILGKNN